MIEDKKSSSLHPLTIIANEAIKIFNDLGFEIATGPEIEDEWYNFDALNVSKDHPARDMQDTFYIKTSPQPSPLKEEGEGRGEFVLRTHTTNVTARALEKAGREGRLPCAFISIGKTFRNEATDATHEMQFFQIDGAMIGENISIADLKGILTKFYKEILGDDIEMEFRPSFFPFVEPGLEVWVKFSAKGGSPPSPGSGRAGASGGKWLEVMGCGMLHPNVLRNVGLDPEKVQGFAFGGGLDRIAMVRWNIPDIRLFYQGDLRLNQF